MTPPLPLLLAFPVLMALLDCWQRPGERFAGGAQDRWSWLKWLIVAVPTVPVQAGSGIVVGGHHSVIRRNSPASRS